jgi:hypothetical protein
VAKVGDECLPNHGTVWSYHLLLLGRSISLSTCLLNFDHIVEERKSSGFHFSMEASTITAPAIITWMNSANKMVIIPCEESANGQS